MRVEKLKIRLLICIYLIFSSWALASELNCEALVRDEKHRLVKRDVSLDDLLSKDKFEGKFFKIVAGKNTEAITVNSPLASRACQAYYHLSTARKYFIEKLNLHHLINQKQLVIRIEMKNGFNDSSHFIHENLGEFFNNALTIPPSGNARLDQVDPWYYEIWFAPKKEMKVKSAFENAANVASSGPVVRQLVLGVAQGQVTTIASRIAQGAEFGMLEGEYYLKSLLFSVGVVALVPNVMKWTSSIFKKTIYLDSGMIPEVIYHEYSHFALSPFVSIDRHSPVTEGVANFYAAMISDSDSILGKTKGHSKGLVEINGKDTKNYDYYMEDVKYAQLDFVFKFLFSFKESFGKERASEMILDAIKVLPKDNISIKEDLVGAIKKVVVNDKKEFYKFQNIIQKFGF